MGWAATAARTLNIDFYEALRLPASKLQILYNEAMRQKAIDTMFMAMAFAMVMAKDRQQIVDYLDQLMKAHGAYVEGFYEEEFKRLREALGK